MEATPEQVFLDCYLTSGNVFEATKKAGLALAVGYELRDRALDDELYAQKRNNIRKQILPDAELMGYHQLQLLAEEIKNTLPVNPLEQWLRQEVGLRPLPDPRQKMIANLSRLIYTLTNVRRTSMEYGGDEETPRGPVVIEVHPTARAERMLGGG